jgi:hypothetical protein
MTRVTCNGYPANFLRMFILPMTPFLGDHVLSILFNEFYNLSNLHIDEYNNLYTY